MFVTQESGDCVPSPSLLSLWPGLDLLLSDSRFKFFTNPSVYEFLGDDSLGVAVLVYHCQPQHPKHATLCFKCPPQPSEGLDDSHTS